MKKKRHETPQERYTAKTAIVVSKKREIIRQSRISIAASPYMDSVYRGAGR